MQRVLLGSRLGFNTREFAYYGTQAYPFTSAALRDAQASGARSFGGSLVRFYGAHRAFDVPTMLNQIGQALEVLRAKDLRAILCLADSLGDSGHVLAAESQFHNQPHGHLHKDYLHSRAYQAHYLPFIRQVAERFGNHPALFAFELRNEFAVHPGPSTPADAQAALAYFQAASEVLKSAAPNVFVSTGLVNVRQITHQEDSSAFARQLYGLPSIDLVSIHYYVQDNEKQHGLRDAAIARELGKPFYIGEIGAEVNTVDRVAFFRSEMNEWFQAGAFAVLPWALYVGAQDVGVSDTLSVARFHPDFDGITSTVASFLNVQPIPLELRTAPVTVLEVGTRTETGTSEVGPGEVRVLNVVTRVTIRVTDDHVRLRAAPIFANNNILRLLARGTIFRDSVREGEWYRTAEGFIHASLVEEVPN